VIVQERPMRGTTWCCMEITDTELKLRRAAL